MCNCGHVESAHDKNGKCKSGFQSNSAIGVVTLPCLCTKYTELAGTRKERAA